MFNIDAQCSTSKLDTECPTSDSNLSAVEGPINGVLEYRIRILLQSLVCHNAKCQTSNLILVAVAGAFESKYRRRSGSNLTTVEGAIDSKCQISDSILFDDVVVEHTRGLQVRVMKVAHQSIMLLVRPEHIHFNFCSRWSCIRFLLLTLDKSRFEERNGNRLSNLL